MRTDQTNVSERAGVRLKVLSDDQIKEIHARSLEILDQTGVYVESEEAIQMLEEAGCRAQDGIVKFPPGLVEWALERAPSRFLLHNRTGEYALNVGGNNTHFGMGPTLLYMLDPDTGERRKFVKSDTEKAARVADALENIEWVMGLGTISDCDPADSEVHEFDAMVRNTTKPLITWAESLEGMHSIIRMAEAVRGGKEALQDAPFIASYSEPISPLTQNQIAVEKLLITADYGIPTVHTPIPQAGASLPVTLAGTLVGINAENLASVTISQVRNPGTPIVFGGVIGTMDMLQAQLAYGSPEMQLMLAAYMDIAHHYDIPTWGTGGCTDSKLPDQQAAIEAGQSVLYSALSGANLVHDPGYMASGTQGSLDMLVMVDEIARMAKYITHGMRANEDTLALDAIEKVGPGGEFLTSSHTFNNFREQLYFPTLMDRQPHDKWVESGAKTMGERIKERYRHILETHEVEPLPDEAMRVIEETVPDKAMA